MDVLQLAIARAKFARLTPRVDARIKPKPPRPKPAKIIPKIIPPAIAPPTPAANALVEIVRAMPPAFLRPPSKTQRVPSLIVAVATRFGVYPAAMCSASRAGPIIIPRQVAMYLARHVVKLSYPRIGRALGGRDHTTVLHACRKIAKLIEEDAELRAIVEELEAKVRGQCDPV